MIGWRRAGFLDGTYLIEVKTSRADFLADAKKSHRQCSTPDAALGNWRFYLCSEGLIEPAELPEKWGLLWADERERSRNHRLQERLKETIADRAPYSGVAP